MERYPKIKVHENCLCFFVPMRTKAAGTATDLGENGADAYLVKYRKLPDYYISKKEAALKGWIPGEGNLAEIAHNKMIGGDNFKNKKGKLPQLNGREWYEADINYISGFRNEKRLLYSNDGLIFITDDHYHTFYELIVQGE